jgi:hypothetical protein
VAKKRKGNGERFVQLPHYMSGSPAFMTLPGDAVKILLDIWRRHNGVNNGEISYSVREAAELGISKSVAARMFAVLEERGFLVKVRNSGFNVKIKIARTWRITAERMGDMAATKDYMRWSPNLKHGPSTGTHGPSTGTVTPDIETILPVSVPPAGPRDTKMGPSRSLHRDTYSVPGGERPMHSADFVANGKLYTVSSPFPLSVTQGPKGFRLVVTAWPPMKEAA